ncbi:MAG: ribose transport system ATP-binding protein [Thermoleophilaceae bacterium]|nr:ribose transport system ATP-binding protein [Thermoleophilaceae bacterium]
MTVVEEPALTVAGLSKAFGSTQALDDVSMRVARGSIHALLGGNGSGKSTLIKILAGVETADSGSLTIGSTTIEAAHQTPAQARDLGVRFVHQQQSTFGELTIAENLAFGHHFERGFLRRIQWSRQRRRAAELLDRFGIEASPRALVSSLRPATQTMVAIARALQDQEGASAGLLVLDEPTASLTSQEVDVLLAALKRYAAAGQTILYVTHRLEEVVAVADESTVLRDGRVASVLPRERLDHDTLVSAIVGRQVSRIFAEKSKPPSEGTVLEAHELCGGPVRAANLQLHPGEIVGVAGLLGSGRTGLLRLLFGDAKPASGEIRIDGNAVTLHSPARAMRAGIVFVPEDRARDASFHELSVRENLAIARLRDFRRVGWIDRRAERRKARELIGEYQISTRSEEAGFGSLSGGNQQKAVLARCLQGQPRIILLDEPTQGVDVGARAEIYRLIRGAVDGGMAALVVYSDLEELAGACDRAIVLDRGRVTCEVSGDELTESRLNELVHASGNGETR